MDEEELEACRKSDKELFCPVPNCGRSLSRKQTLQKHLWSCHEIKGIFMNCSLFDIFFKE